MTITRVPSLAHWGAFTAIVKDGRVVACEPFAQDDAPSPMLSAIPEMLYSPLRIRKPAIRDGWREGAPRTGHDSFREVEWDEALDLVSSEIQRVRGAYGDTAIFGGSYGWSSAGRLHHARSLVRRFLFQGGGCVDQVGNYSWGAAQILLPHVIGTYQPVTGRVTDWASVVKHTKLIIAFGGLRLSNAQVTSGGAGGHFLESWLHRAKTAGIKFVIISPTKSDAPDFLEAEWIPIRPNTDTALMLAMAHTLFAEGLDDAEFLARHCVGTDRFKSYVLGESDGTPKDADWAAAICGIDANRIRDLARHAASTNNLLTCTWSLQRARHGEQPYWALIALATILGGIGLPGRGFAFGHGSLNGVGVPRLPLPGPELPSPKNPAKAGIPVARVTDMLMSPGDTYDFNGHGETYPDIRMIYWAGGNPFHHHQDLNRLRRAWQKPQTIVVHDSWWTPTARHADIVLPATTSLERNDVGGSSRDPFILAMHQAIPPVGEARNDYEIFRQLAARLGYEQLFTEGRDEMEWCRLIYDGFRTSATSQSVELPDFDDFWNAGFAMLPPPDDDFVLFDAFRRDPERNPLKTPSGKIELTSDTIASFGYDDCPPHPAWLPPEEWLGGETARRWPLHLLTHQPAGRLHSQMDSGSISRGEKVHEREPVRINPADAKARGITNGAVIRLFNDRGACLAAAMIDDNVMPGVLMMATGAWFDPDDAAGEPERHGNPNVLTRDVGTSRLAQGPSALTALVEAERWQATLPAIKAFTPPAVHAAQPADSNRTNTKTLEMESPR